MQKVSIELNESKQASSGVPIGFLENAAFGLLLLLPFLLPLFFIPSSAFQIQFSKMFLLSVFVLAAFAFWIIARLKDGRFVFPGSALIWGGGLILLATVLSALLSGAVKASFVGQAIETGSAGGMAILFLMMFLVPIIFQSKDRIFYAYLLFFASFFLIALFQIARLIFGADFLSFGIFTDITANMVGKWNDLGVFFGIGTVLSLITLEMITLSKLFKILSYSALAISLFFLAIVNFAPVWYVTALFSLIFLVYIISFDKNESAQNDSEMSGESPSPIRKIPITSLSVLLISLVFILGGNTISGAIGSKFNINQVEARPSWSATLAIAKNVLAQDPFFGAGPNRFSEKWVLYKPDGINSTVFWNSDFNFGIGLVPTFLVTTGLLGAISWIVFLGLFLMAGFKAILSSTKDRVSRYLVSSSFLVSLFLWIINVFYITSLPLLALTFFFTGLFIASLFQSGAIKPRVISFIDDPKKSFVSVLALILLLIGTIAVSYSFTEKFMASTYFNKGSDALANVGDPDLAEGYLNKAVGLDGDSSYYRALVQVDMLRMSTLISQNPKNLGADALRGQFQIFLSSALNHAQQAVAGDSVNYQNWMSLGQVYEAVVPIKIASAYESAVNSYKQALSLNPKSPAILLTIARLEATHGDSAKAKDYIAQALQQKNNYTDAIFLLAQIQVAEGNIRDAISSVEAASYLAPSDSGVFFQLGLLRYNNKDYQGAASALEQALALNPSYANAKYFLGLSYQKLGRVKDAVAQFKDLKTANPDNKEIDLILRNLNAGLSPFSNATPPIDSQPEKRAKPPVQESSKKSSPVDANI